VTSSTTTAVDDIDVGQVNIRAGDTIRIRNGSQISATTRSQNPRANVGGNINITTNRLQVTNGADLRASTSGEGNAGLIEIRANEFFLDNATIFNNVEEGAMGDAGIIQIATNLLTLTNGAQLQSLVSEADNGLPAGEGNAGEIIIDANDAVYLDGISPTDRLSSLISTSIQRGAIGQGGDIRITTPFLSVTDGAGLTVNARGRRGSAGNIQIRADRIILSDRPEEIGTLSATTRAGNGSGEITIQGLNTGQETFLLLMKNESEISARAFGRANGGNITINEVQDGFILATPENNDIIASAERGRGGEIEINTFAIFGLEERNPLTDLSDINASSEFGTNGEIVRNTLGIDPTRGLGELPIETLDADDQVVEGCIGRNASRDSDVEQGEFSQTGRGGLSPDPTAPLTGETLIEQLATLDEDAGTEANVSPEEPEEIEPLLVEAQGLARNAQNHVTLVASSSTPSSSHLPGVPPNQCDVP
jgi:large exoprotein involved in heme utilization and adhesion